MKKGFYNLLKGGVMILLLITCLTTIVAQSNKVVGYLPTYRFQMLDNLSLHQLTDICIAFANPDEEGNLSFNDYANPFPVIQKAHEHNVRVFLSLAGGGMKPEWKRNWKKLQQPAYRDAFVQNIINYARAYEFDGIDVDLEWKMVGPYYSDFVVALGTAAKEAGLLYTAALPGIHRYNEITDQALAIFDWVNLMSYDLTGPWKPAAAGQHAPLSLVDRSIAYWEAQGLPRPKMVIGVPFYGFDFSNPRRTKVMGFADIIALGSRYAQRDRVHHTYYNGVPTIRAKAEQAFRETGGIMIWEIGQDATGSHSLLSTIADCRSQFQNMTSPIESSPTNEPIPILVNREIKEVKPIQPFASTEKSVADDENYFATPDEVLLELRHWEKVAMPGKCQFIDASGRVIYEKGTGTPGTLKIYTSFLINHWQWFSFEEDQKLTYRNTSTPGGTSMK